MESITNQLAAVIKDLFGVDIVVVLGRPSEQFGDYSTNIAMQLAGQLHKNPREVAEAIADKLRETKLVKEVSVAGPGFINIVVHDDLLLLQDKPSRKLTGQVVVTEFSDPNPFKTLHVGHLYTTIVGDAISNLIERAGGEVHRVNFGGDVGLHVAKSMWSIIEKLGGEYPERLQDSQYGPMSPSNSESQAWWLSERYVEGSSAYESNDEIKDKINEINALVYELHEKNDHDSSFAQIYWLCRDWSYDYFKWFYAELGLRPFEKFYPESLTTPIGIETVKEGIEKEVFENSDGAIIYRGEKDGLHTRVFITNKGLPTYETKDLGLAVMKWQDYKFDRNIIITGNDIIEYMKVVLSVLGNFYPEIVERTEHLTHGVVKLQGGVKMSSRQGNVLGALDIIYLSGNEIHEIYPNADLETKKMTMYGAVKYAFLKNRVGGDIIYSPEESVSLEGNSGPYLQYAHARAKSIILKSDKQAKAPSSLLTEERQLMRMISEFEEVIDKATSERMPHYICTYLYELAQAFNGFYEKCRIISDPRESERLWLITRYADILKEGLGILGIIAPEHM